MGCARLRTFSFAVPWLDKKPVLFSLCSGKRPLQQSLLMLRCREADAMETGARDARHERRFSRHHPACRSRCFLCLGRAAARPVAARQTDRGRRRRGARRLL
ncbi:hypothetical protein MPLB_190026 [Mesorhizobium sp. ORS 3324]|nr:hypothetical protein MPLB_190026 [Mesorhizobium sp. ORS 3324]